MLEQIRSRTQTTFAKVILVIIIIPFALLVLIHILSSVGSDIILLQLMENNYLSRT